MIKPFIEKPLDAENHNIYIYYPKQYGSIYFIYLLGGGCKKLFRKIGNQSSEYHKDVNRIRKDGSYIYE